MRVLQKDKGFSKFIVSLNTNEQLGDEGVGIDGKKLKSDFSPLGQAYATNTILGTSEYKGRQELGLQTDHVDLKVTGKFWSSFKIIMTSNFDLEIMANTTKENGDLQDTWGNIVGLTSENYERAITRAQEILREYVKGEITTVLKKAA